MRREPDGRLILEGAVDIYVSQEALEKYWPLVSANGLETDADHGLCISWLLTRK